MNRLPSVALIVFALDAACSASSTTAPVVPPFVAPEADAAVDARVDSAAPDARAESAAPQDAASDVNKAAACAATFGQSLTNAFGRFDGTVLAVVPPADDACAEPNHTHLVLQVTAENIAYRMVLDVLSPYGNPDVFFYEEDAPLVDGAWSAGWHPGVTLDYVTTLKIHSTQFTDRKQTPLVDKVTSEITLGAHVSVFATSAGEPDSAHLIHRNLTGQDGAIVLNPESDTPHWLFFRFGDQSF